ncbi:MAG TPA: amino acid adenylation domain-containing protein [Verrucomicrobiae bacterium]|nr:amino acid adenylation domain-containing protein [Verrucomicrobiae bacterium]
MTSAPNSPKTLARREAAPLPSRDEFIRAHYRCQEGRFFTAVQLGQTETHCASDISVPMWNHSAWFGQSALTPHFLSQAEEWHAQHGRRPVIYSIEEISIEGYERFDRETWMVRDVSTEKSPRADFKIQAASDLREFTKIFRAAFSVSSAAYDEALRRGDQKHLIARQGKDAVAVGTVIHDTELACIYNVGSAPQFRGRGAGRAMMEAAITVAREAGCRWVFLQVETGSLAERLYVKLGFEPLFTRTGYRKSNWTAHEAVPQESALSKALGFSGKISGAARSEGHETRALSAETATLLKKLCDTESVTREQVVNGLWAILLSRYLHSSEVEFRIENKTVRANIADASTLPWIKSATTAAANADSAETIVAFGSRKAPLLSVALNFKADSFELAYRTELFSKDSMRRMANHFALLLEALVQNPHRKIHELEFLNVGEKQQLLQQWSKGGDIEWNGETIVELLDKRAKETPNETALILAETADPQKNRKFTYAELMTRAAQRACALIQAGVTPGSSVGVLLPRSLEVAISMLAIWRAGAVFVPLDSTYPAERIAFMASDSAMKAVITTQSLSPTLPAAVKKIFIDTAEQFEASATVDVKPSDPAYVIYTSGSTGQPKGVTISHGAIAQHTVAMVRYYEITASDRHLHFSPFTFDASFEQLLPPLIAGASVVVRDDRLWDVSEFLQNIAAFGLTMVDIPMAYWHQLAQHAIGVGSDKIPDHLRLIIAGGEAMAPDRLAPWQQGPFANRRLVNAYGPTEATVTATAFEASDFKTGESGSVPIGRPLPGREAYILDNFLQPVPVRVVGQLYLGGTLLAAGYLNRPELTAQKFIKNPFGEGRLYATGDMARYLEDGAIEFLGRIDDQIKIRGFRVEPGEIEIALQEHPAVRDAVVIAKDDGGGQKRLIGYVTPRNGKISEREIRQWLRGRLPEYMTPSAIVAVKEFPLLTSGKVNRKALPDPASVSTATSPSNAIPKTPLELQLQILFQRVLRRNGVNVDESFFELGGDSLQALELIVQIEKATGRRLPLETLFQTPTVQRLAIELQRAGKGEDWSCLVTLQKSGVRPPLFLVHTTPGDVLGYGNLIHHLGDDQPCYGFQALGLKDGGEPHATIEAMAAHYVDLLRKFQPNGPYYLGGWCFGGIVAVEMAQQLRNAGQEVAPLLLMETISVPPGPGNVKYHAARLKCLFSMSPHRWRQYLRAKAKYKRQVDLDNRMRFRQAGENVDTEQRRWLERLERVYNANLTALDAYRSEPYHGKIILFNAVEKDPGILPDPNYGWSGMADDIEIHEVAGNHDTMLAEPNVASLAKAMRKALF